MAQGKEIATQATLPPVTRSFMPDGPWVTGCNTLIFPTDIPQGTYVWGTNIWNRGGVVQTRPRKNLLFTLPGQRVQGFIGFRSLDGTTVYLVWAIDGLVYYSVFPFLSYQQISGIQLSPTAQYVYFCVAIKALQYSTGSITTGILAAFGPIQYLFMQDGVSNPVWWDGQNVFQSSVPYIPPSQGGGGGVTLPIGTSMAWDPAGTRLWVAIGRQLFASDFLQPDQFQEDTYLGEASGFLLPRPITLVVSPPPNPQGLTIFAFTEDQVQGFQGGITTRANWQTTQGFQQIVSAEFGSPGPFGYVNQHGLPWWWSAKGLVNLNMAAIDRLSNIVYPQDGEMFRSKNLLAPLQQGVALGFFENVMLVSVPYCSQYNRQTWIMDGGTAQMLNSPWAGNIAGLTPSMAGLCWQGAWAGTYPVQWATIVSGGVQHLYELSYCSGEVTQPNGNEWGIQIWENFISSIIAEDDLTPVTCQWESRMFMMPNGELFRAAYVEFILVNVIGTVTMQVYLGGLAGLYELQTGVITLKADPGPFFSQEVPLIYQGDSPTPDTNLESFRPQSRFVRSVETLSVAQSQIPPLTDAEFNVTGANPHVIEVGFLDYLDKAFQIYVTWTGVMGIKSLKLFYRPESEQVLGQIPPNESGTQKAVLQHGL